MEWPCDSVPTLSTPTGSGFAGPEDMPTAEPNFG